MTAKPLAKIIHYFITCKLLKPAIFLLPLYAQDIFIKINNWF